MLRRHYHELGNYLKPGKVLIIYGPRRAGKTTLLEDYLQRSPFRWRLDSGDNIRVQKVLSSSDFDVIREYAQGYDLIAIDEAQRIPNIGMGLKIIVDQIPGIRIVATGSSSFDLSQSVGEPLTGRKRTLTLYPLAQMELLHSYNRHELRERLEEWLIFGSYPETVLTAGRKNKMDLLQELTESYLLKDILALERVKGADVLFTLVQLIAHQLGQPVSIRELATQLRLDQKTVNRYLDLLEKSFVIHRLKGFGRNLRKEISRKCKYYFLDNGIRNAAINHFNPLSERKDIGALWENFLLSERLKRTAFHREHVQRYFWRTYDQVEIDFVEQSDGQLDAYEAKWSPSNTPSAPMAWVKAYPEATYQVVSPRNYFDFVL